MRPISRWRHLMASTCTVEARTGQDVDNVPTYGAATSYACHLSRKRRLVRNAVGQEVVSSQAIYLNSNADIQPTARVTLTTGDVGSTEAYAIRPVLVAVERRFDQHGPHHTVLYME